MDIKEAQPHRKYMICHVIAKNSETISWNKDLMKARINTPIFTLNYYLCSSRNMRTSILGLINGLAKSLNNISEANRAAFPNYTLQ